MGPAPPDGAAGDQAGRWMPLCAHAGTGADKHVVEAEPGLAGAVQAPPDGVAGKRSGEKRK